MPTITRTQVRQEMLKRAPILGKALTADSFTKSGPSLTHVAEYERQRAGLTSFEGVYIHRYNFTNNDRWRRATTLNSGASDGVLNVDGPAYLDNSDLAYERLTVHPDDLNFAIAEAQRRQRVKTNIALVYPGIDLDMEAGNANFWNGTSGNSFASNVTVANDTTTVFSGTKSKSFTGTGANPTSRSGYMRVSPNRQTYVAAIVIFNTGPISMKVYDPINAVYLGSTLTQTQVSNWSVFELQFTTNSNTGIIQIEFSSTNAAAVWLVDTCFGPYQAGQTEYLLQTSLDEAYKVRFVRPSKFTSPAQIAGISDANSMLYIGDLTHPEDWDIEAFRRDINFNRLRFQANSYNLRNIGWGFPSNIPGGVFMRNTMCPIWLAMEAQVSDFEPLSTETSTTNQPLDECACYALRYIAETMTERDPSNVVWQQMFREYAAWSVIEDQARPPQAMYTPQRYHHTLI